MVIGRGGQGVDELRKDLEKPTKKSVSVNVVEVKSGYRCSVSSRKYCLPIRKKNFI